MLNGECFVVNFAVFTIDSTGRALVLPGLQDTEIIFLKKTRGKKGAENL